LAAHVAKLPHDVGMDLTVLALSHHTYLEKRERFLFRQLDRPLAVPMNCVCAAHLRFSRDEAASDRPSERYAVLDRGSIEEVQKTRRNTGRLPAVTFCTRPELVRAVAGGYNLNAAAPRGD